MRPYLLLWFFVGFFAFNAFSQPYNPKCRYTSFGLNLKASYFHGDVSTDLRYVRPGIGAHINRKLSPRWSVTGELFWVRLMGNDFTSANPYINAQVPLYVRNLHFRNDIQQISGVVKYDLFPCIDHYRKRPIYNLYGLVGLSGFHHNPKAKSKEGKWVALRKLQTEGVKYSAWQIAIPVGVGVRYKLSLQWDLEVELQYMITFTDYLDDVSGNYADPSKLSSDKARAFSNRTADTTDALSGSSRDLQYLQKHVGKVVVQNDGYSYVSGYGPGAKRGSQKGFDGYFLFNIRLSYAIPGFINCPKFREMR